MSYMFSGKVVDVYHLCYAQSMRAKKSANRKGFYLVSALVISLVIALFVSASLKLSIGNLKANSAQDKVALFAAESGLRYVQARL